MDLALDRKGAARRLGHADDGVGEHAALAIRAQPRWDMQSLPAIQIVQDRIGIPVTSTAVCTTWKMLKLLGLQATVPDAGALLAPGSNY